MQQAGFEAWARDPFAVDTAAIEQALRAEGDALQALYAAANAVRARCVGEEIHVRGIVEFSNWCRKNCAYCGIRRGNHRDHRYRIGEDEILELAHAARKFGFGTLVLQSGEDPRWGTERLCALLRRLKAETGLAATLSVGELPAEEYRALAAAGCDRFLMRFESSLPEVFAALHPDDDLQLRLRALEDLRAAGIQVGSGFMIGLPGQGYAGLARDLRFATELRLDMIGVGPFLPAPETPLATEVPGFADREVYFKAIALLRLLNPDAHIPATTAFDTLERRGRERLLKQGCNVFMPNLTPESYRRHYQLYPNKACVDSSPEHCCLCVVARLKRLGRPLGKGPGHSLRQPAAGSLA